MKRVQKITETVSRTVTDNLCVSCEACSAVCPKSAISFVFQNGMFLPKVETSKCCNCGLCRKVCPSAEMAGVSRYKRGKMLKAYSAYSKDNVLRQISTSGGVVSQLICKLLANEVYKKAYVVKFERFDGEIARLAPVECQSDVLAAARSKYVPVAINEVISAVRHNCIGRSIIVCTPCQLLAIKRAIRIYKILEDIILFIGLFCERMFNYGIYDYYRKEFGEFESLHFRDKNPNRSPVRPTKWEVWIGKIATS